MKRLSILLPFLLTAPLGAQVASVAERFAGFDKNNDGLIAGEEMQAAPYLPKLDLNGNGSLTLEEAEKAVQLAERAKKPTAESPSAGKTGIAEFDNLDKNGDGLLTENEMPQKRWMRFLDQDSNGTVTLAEATEAMARLRRKGGTPESATPAKPASEDPELKEAPVVLKASDHGVGRLVADLTLQDSRGQNLKLSERLKGQQGLIVAFFGATCPISGKLGPELARLEKAAQEQKVGMLLVCPVAVETQNDIQTYITTHVLKSPVVHDQDGRLSAALAATTTTEVFLLDAARTLTYIG
ncbi:MAG TPA: hypothetical protein DCP71_12720 [Verrucomicrobiales bacterium]|nr:hypothetical protein [Verrucomicrobiales bacterium]